MNQGPQPPDELLEAMHEAMAPIQETKLTLEAMANIWPTIVRGGKLDPKRAATLAWEHAVAFRAVTIAHLRKSMDACRPEAEKAQAAITAWQAENAPGSGPKAAPDAG